MSEWADEKEEKTGIKYNIYKDGLKIFTTINSKMQLMLKMQLKITYINFRDNFMNTGKILKMLHMIHRGERVK